MRARFVSSRKSDLDRNERNRVKIGRKRNHLLGDHPSNAPIPPFPPRTGWKPWRIRWSWRRFRGGRGYGRPSSSRGEAASPQRYRPEGGPSSRSRGGISQPSRRSLGQLDCPPSRTRIIFRSPSLQQRYLFHHRSAISTSSLCDSHATKWEMYVRLRSIKWWWIISIWGRKFSNLFRGWKGVWWGVKWEGLTHALRILYADSLYANGCLVHTHTLRSLWTSLPPCISPPISSNFLSSHAYEYLSSCGTRSTCNAKNIDYIFLAPRFPLLKNIVAFFN